MSRESRDVVGFKRIFVFFCTLVLLPAMLMSGFAVVAMRNESQAEKLRQRERADRLLFRAETALLSVLEETDAAARQAFRGGRPPEEALHQLRAAGLPVGPALVVASGSAVLVPMSQARSGQLFEPPFDGAGEEVAGLLARVHTVGFALSSGESAHIDVPEPQAGVLSVQRLDDERILAFVLDEERLSARIAEEVPPERNLSVRLQVARAAGPKPEVGAVERLMADLVRSAASSEGWLSGDGGEAPVRRLAAPFERFSLRVSGAPSSSTARVLAIYIALLLVFYATLITGVVLTSRLVWQEARLSALKTDFVSHVSHELRTPLTSIRMFIETLKIGRASPEERQECVDLLSRETERLSEMIERVLGYARLKSGRRQFQVAAVSVTGVVGEAIDAFRAQQLGAAGHESLELVRDVPDDIPPVLADSEALVEALVNLVSNAYKYTGPKKRIRVFARRGRKRRIEIGVEDNGPGLPKSEHKRIFERFYQARSLLTRTSQGSGLGLAITKGIVEGLGGRIRVESEPGRGATFLIELRRAPADNADTGRPRDALVEG